MVENYITSIREMYTYRYYLERGLGRYAADRATPRCAHLGSGKRTISKYETPRVVFIAVKIEKNHDA